MAADFGQHHSLLSLSHWAARAVWRVSLGQRSGLPTYRALPYASRRPQAQAQHSMAALTSPGVGITVNVSRRDSQEYLRLHQLEPYLEDAAVYALYAEDDLPPAERLRGLL